jgi:hypothetical protein
MTLMVFFTALAGLILVMFIFSSSLPPFWIGLLIGCVVLLVASLSYLLGLTDQK